MLWENVALCQLVCRKIIFAVLDVSFFSFSCVIEVHTRCYKLEVFYINICGFSSARRKYATVFILFATYNLSAIAVPHRDDTDIIMPLNMVTLYD